MVLCVQFGADAPSRGNVVHRPAPAELSRNRRRPHEWFLDLRRPRASHIGAAVCAALVPIRRAIPGNLQRKRQPARKPGGNAAQVAAKLLWKPRFKRPDRNNDRRLLQPGSNVLPLRAAIVRLHTFHARYRCSHVLLRRAYGGSGAMGGAGGCAADGRFEKNPGRLRNAKHPKQARCGGLHPGRAGNGSRHPGMQPASNLPRRAGA